MTTWMDLEGIVLSEISHAEKDKYSMISLICGEKKKKPSEKRRIDWYLPEAVGGRGRSR